MMKDQRDISTEYLQQIIDNLNYLHEISQKISETKPLPELLSEIMESSKQLMNAEASSLLLYDPQAEKLHFQVATGEKGELIKKYSVDLGVGCAGWVAKHQKSILIEDCYQDARFDSSYDKKSNFTTKSLICVPLIRKKQLLGVMQVINKKGDGIFDKWDLRIFETLASQCAIAIENHKLTQKQIEGEALERELEMARRVQQKFLPESLPEYEDIQVAARLIPAKQVGGDMYSIIKINENQSLFLVADVSGKGVPAALIVATIFSSLLSYLKLNKGTFDLMTLVTAMNLVLLESTESTKFATCWFGLYYHDSKKMLNINAGHNPPCIYRESLPEPIRIRTGGLFLGGMDLPYQVEEIQLMNDDVLVFFSDGVTEAMNEKHEVYGEDRLGDLIYDNIKKSATDILSEIEKDVAEHVGKAQQSDDITCAVVRVL